MSALEDPWSIDAASPSNRSKSRALFAFWQRRLSTLAGLSATSAAAYLELSEAHAYYPLPLFFAGLFLCSQGKNLRIALLWMVGCLFLLVPSFKTLSLFDLDWLTPNKQIIFGAMIGVLGSLLYRWWRGYELERRINGESSERQELADALPHVIWGTSTDGRCEFLNDRYTETFGINRSTAIKEQSWVDPIHPADLGKMQQAWRSAIGGGSSFYSALARMRMNDGSYRWMESIGRPIRSTRTGDALRWFGSLLDVQNQVDDRETITRLQFDLQAICDERESNAGRADARFRALFETREAGWIVYDIKSVGSLCDSLKRQGIADFGEYMRKYPADTLKLIQGIRPIDANPHIVSSLGFESFENLLSSRIQDSSTTYEVEIGILIALTKGSTTTCGIARLSDAIGGMKGLPFTVCILEGGTAKAVFLDVPMAEKHAEEAGKCRMELARANRVAAASALSASLIHQISQPISAISLDIATATRLMTSGESDSAAVRKVMDRLRWNTQRLSDVGISTREALRHAPQTLQAVDIADLALRSYRLLLDPLDADEHSLKIAVSNDLPIVLADPLALQQVMFALFQNALEAHASAGDMPDISVTVSSASSQKEIKVEVADRGPGIDRELMALVFDPFFSTKTNHLGFGLTVCQRVVEDFGGTLTLSNRPGRGVSAHLTIPNR